MDLNLALVSHEGSFPGEWKSPPLFRRFPSDPASGTTTVELLNTPAEIRLTFTKYQKSPNWRGAMVRDAKGRVPLGLGTLPRCAMARIQHPSPSET